MENIKDLQDLLKLERIETNIFRGENYKTPWGRVFGGQVLAQSLHAAMQTVPEDRFVHSMHAYFILSGDISMPIVYEVDQIRDGGSFTTRRVIAIQKGRPIFNMAASFQVKQDGFEHHTKMPKVPMPETLKSDKELSKVFKTTLPFLYHWFHLPRPIEFRPVEPYDFVKPQKHQPVRHIWIKAKGVMPDQKQLHQEVLAYVSDYNLLSTSLLPHRDEVRIEDMQMASLDHAMWFHQDFRMDEWLLYATDSPSSSNSRGFSRGSFFTRDGKLVASVVQEGLIRKRK